MLLFKTPFCFLCYFLLTQNVKGASLEEELTLTHKQKVKLDQLRELVAHRVPHSYMSEDWQLVKWLRVTKYDVQASEKMILENIKWREDNKMDTILDEDWSDFDSNEYRVSVEGCKDGRPIVSIDVGDWPVRTVVLTGKKARFLRYLDKTNEEGAVLVRELQKIGHNVTQIVDLYDFTNYNPATHICFQCLGIYVHIAQTAEKNYPLLSHASIMTNVPAVYMSVHQLLRSFVSEESKNSWIVYGRDKIDWKETLRKTYGAENLSKQFGGEKEDVWTVEEVRKNPSLFKCHKT